MNKSLMLLLLYLWNACVCPGLADLTKSNKHIHPYAPVIESKAEIQKYQFDNIRNPNGPFGEVYDAHLIHDSSKPLIIKLVIAQDVATDESDYNPCAAYDKQRELSGSNPFVFKLIETIPVSITSEDKHFCLVVMEKALKVFDSFLFDEVESEQDLAKNTEALKVYLDQIIEGVVKIHKSHHLHNDLKASNFLLVANEKGELKPAINDFDLASDLDLEIKFARAAYIHDALSTEYSKLSEAIEQIISTNKYFIVPDNFAKEYKEVLKAEHQEAVSYFDELCKESQAHRRTQRKQSLRANTHRLAL